MKIFMHINLGPYFISPLEENNKIFAIVHLHRTAFGICAHLFGNSDHMEHTAVTLTLICATCSGT